MAIVWARRYRQTGGAVARRQGRPRSSRLDTHEGFILGLVDAGTKDISLVEIVERLAAEWSLRIGTTLIWSFLDRHA